LYCHSQARLPDLAMEIEPIGWVETCFDEKFGVPRQSGLCPSSWGVMHFHEKYRQADLVRGLQDFSHVWLIFAFHQTLDHGWTPTVRPPRLGGNQRVGVLATRSTFRPNGLGLSLCRLERVETSGELRLFLGGIDLVSGTPIYDVKPYLSYCDAVPEASCGYAADPPLKLSVVVAPAAEQAFSSLTERTRDLIFEALALDPRPAIHDDTERIYGVRLAGLEVRFQVADRVTIASISPQT
jgi:tRNA (adenine37-N6)-methyltransferase